MIRRKSPRGAHEGGGVVVVAPSVPTAARKPKNLDEKYFAFFAFSLSLFYLYTLVLELEKKLCETCYVIILIFHDSSIKH